MSQSRRKQNIKERVGVQSTAKNKSSMLDYIIKSPSSSSSSSNSSTSAVIVTQSTQNQDDNDSEYEDVEENDTGKISSEIPKKRAKVHIKPSFDIPQWMTKYFRYIGHVENSIAKRSPIEMECLKCFIDPKCKKSTLTGPSKFNFIRHLESMHNDDYQIEFEKGNIKPTTKSSTVNVGSTPLLSFGAWKKPTNKDAYSHSHPLQHRFINDLMDCVSIDHLPLDFISRPTFMKLIRNLDQKIRLVSRRTVTRRFKEYYEKKFKPKVKKFVKDLEDENLHIILDMWTDRKKSSIIGFKAQFIDKEWKLRNLVLAFRTFPDRHTAVNIRKMFQSVLEQTFGISPQKVGFVHGDNAENVIAAFKSPKSTNFIDVEDGSDLELDENEDDEVNWITFEDLMESSDEDEPESDLNGEKCLNTLIEKLDEWKGAKTIKLPCFSHLIQLIIQDALTTNPEAARLVKAAHDLKTFFHRSNFWYDRFKEEANIGLTEQAATRWNTVYYVFSRLLKTEVQTALSQIVSETLKRKTPCPVSFSHLDYTNMKHIVNLLKPLQEATDELQADTVTSSHILPLLSLAYKEIAAVDVDNEPEMESLKIKLCECLADRFGPRVDSGQHETPGTRKRKIVREELHKNENIILATLLDPRLKTVPFRLKFPEPYGFNGNACSEKEAEAVLRKKCDEMKSKYSLTEDDSCSIIHHPTPSKSSLLDGLNNLDTPRQHQQNVVDEVMSYIEKDRESKECDPLDFWKNNENKYPALARLARKYLGFPASSGSVERLFSVSGLIQRSRRARLSWVTIEYLLCHREMRRLELFGK